MGLMGPAVTSRNQGVGVGGLSPEKRRWVDEQVERSRRWTEAANGGAVEGEKRDGVGEGLAG